MWRQAGQDSDNMTKWLIFLQLKFIAHSPIMSVVTLTPGPTDARNPVCPSPPIQWLVTSLTVMEVAEVVMGSGMGPGEPNWWLHSCWVVPPWVTVM